MTGVLHAWQDSIPCIFISGQQNYSETIAASGLPLRQVGVQEADIVKLVSPITKYAVMITDAADIAYELDKAIFEARNGRQGPVWIDVPLNIQNTMVDEESLRRYEGKYDVYETSGDDISYVVGKLKNAKRPILIAGEGVRRAKAITELKEFAHKVNIPVVFTRLTADLFQNDDPMKMGILCATGPNREANFAVQNSDLILSVGCRLSIDTIGSDASSFGREAEIIVVDIDETEHKKKGVSIDRFVRADAGDFLRRLILAEISYDDGFWIEKCMHWKELFNGEAYITQTEKINFKEFLKSFSKMLPPESIYLSDAGMTGVAPAACCDFKEGDRYLHSYAQGEMGYAIPGAVGAACLGKGKIFAISGDGSFMMNLQELQTIVRNKFNITIVINNNNGYSGVRHGQKAHFRGKSIGTDSSNGLDFPDFQKISEAFGITYFRIEKESEIQSITAKILEQTGCVICEVISDENQFEIHNALVTYGKRKFGFRPIEDQSPFIDRDVFFEEMIVKPMETSYGKPV